MTTRRPAPLVIPIRAFTTAATSQRDVLKNDVRISTAFDAHSQPAPDQFRQFTAIWDTGATNSVIGQKVIDQCHLVPTGKVKVKTASGSYITDTYLVGILLRNNVVFPQVRVSKGEVAGGDVLIGMDIIGAGDFAVTNVDGKTVFTFRYPSVEKIDFVKEIDDGKTRRGQLVTEQENITASPKVQKVGRNDPCPCGSGKKFKRCHGK